jgi:hypothetical protein
MQDDDSSTKRLKLASAQVPKTRPRARSSRAAQQAAVIKHGSNDLTVSEPAKESGESFEDIEMTAASTSAAPTGPPKTSAASTSGMDKDVAKETQPEAELSKRNYKRKKLAPARPWPIIPTSVTASTPRSSHNEGKNYICVTRRTQIGAYLRRCKDVILKDGCVLGSDCICISLILTDRTLVDIRPFT